MYFKTILTLAILLASCPPVDAELAQQLSHDAASQLKILDLQYLESGDDSRLVIRANLPFSYRSYRTDPLTLVITTDPADISGIEHGLNIGSRSIESISVANSNADASEITEFTIKHSPKHACSITPKGRLLFVDFEAEVGNVDDQDVETTGEPAKRNVNNEKSKSSEGASFKKTEGNISSSKQNDVDPLNYRMNPVAVYNLRNIRIEESEVDTSVVVSLDREVERRFFRIVPVGQPPRFVVDLHGARNLLKEKGLGGAEGFFKAIRSAQFATSPYPISRIVLDLSGQQKPEVLTRGKDLIVRFANKQEQQAVKKVDVAKQQPEPKQEQQTTVTRKAVKAASDKKDEDTGALARRLIEEKLAEMKEPSSVKKTEAAGKSDNQKEAGKPAEVKSNANIQTEKKTAEEKVQKQKDVQVEQTVQLKPLPDTKVGKKPEAGKPDTNEPKTTKAEKTEIAVKQQGAKVAEKAPERVETKKPANEAKPAVERTSQKAEDVRPANEAEETYAASTGSQTVDPIAEDPDLFEDQFPDGLRVAETRSSSRPAGRSSITPLRTQETPQESMIISTGDQQFFETTEITPGETRYFGKKVSLEFESINLRALIILLGQMTDKNFVVDPSVQPINISLSLRDLPWDQALDIILDHYGLGKIEEGNVIRIATRQRLTQEAEERRQLALQRSLAVPVRQVAKPVNYAKAQDLATLIRRNLSSKGEVVVDTRTNTIVLTDIPTKVEEHLRLLEALDIPTKQVIVEARIVETTRDYINEFGLQYGFRGSATSEYGSSTGLIFPSQATISGGGPEFSSGSFVPFAVNLPANTINSSLLGTFSNINGSFVLDAILTAAESDKKVRVLSRPRISAQNNTQAEIKSGVEVPFQVIQNNTVGIRWREATLKLTVTPHITADRTVILDLVVDKSSLGIATAVGFTIQKREATSTVLVKDGGVAVIGGVLEISNNLTEERTPFLSKLPLIGRLFRNRLERIQNNELLIFVSPKIIN